MIYKPVKNSGDEKYPECTVGFFRFNSVMCSIEIEDEVSWLVWDNIDLHSIFLTGAIENEDSK